MNRRRKCGTSSQLLAMALCAAIAVVLPSLHSMNVCFAAAIVPQNPQGASRRIGAIKAINGITITLTPDSGSEVTVTVQPSARIVRIAPGEKDLKNATPIQLQDLQVGDRILVGGKAADDNVSLLASSVVVMKRSDLDARHQQDLQDWQKRGVGGLVGAVNPSAGTVTISVVNFSGKKDVVIKSSKSTVIRRYAPDSVKFDDAKASTLQEIHPGDQVRARGDRNADGAELAAEEIVSGSFRNVAGTVASVDAAASSITVQDLLSKKTVIVKVTPDSQLHHLSPEMAQRIATRLKGPAAGAATASGAAPAASSAPTATPGQSPSASTSPGTPEGAMGARGSGMGGRSGGAPDLQQMLGRMPAASLADLHKGDAVLIVTTQGTSGGTAITLLSGVDPILQAAPNAAQAMMLAPWSLGGPSGDVGGP